MGNYPSNSMINYSIDINHTRLKNYFSGTWYEQARYYMFWEAGCSNAQARYSMNSDETVKIVNGCNQFGIWHEMEGKGEQVIAGKGIFQVSFFPGQWGGYNIVYLQDEDNDKGLSFVAGDNFKYFWVLTRRPTLSTEEEARICSLLKNLGMQWEPMLKQKDLIWNSATPCEDIN